MTALVLLHPAMTGAEAHAWCERWSHALEVQQRQGKFHLIVVAQPRPSPPTVPTLFQCSGCGWAGANPDWVDTTDHFSPPWGTVPYCPRCDAPYPTVVRSL